MKMLEVVDVASSLSVSPIFVSVKGRGRSFDNGVALPVGFGARRLLIFGFFIFCCCRRPWVTISFQRRVMLVGFVGVEG